MFKIKIKQSSENNDCFIFYPNCQYNKNTPVCSRCILKKQKTYMLNTFTDLHVY